MLTVALGSGATTSTARRRGWRGGLPHSSGTFLRGRFFGHTHTLEEDGMGLHLSRGRPGRGSLEEERPRRVPGHSRHAARSTGWSEAASPRRRSQGRAAVSPGRRSRRPSRRSRRPRNRDHRPSIGSRTPRSSSSRSEGGGMR